MVARVSIEDLEKFNSRIERIVDFASEKGDVKMVRQLMLSPLVVTVTHIVGDLLNSGIHSDLKEAISCATYND